MSDTTTGSVIEGGLKQQGSDDGKPEKVVSIGRGKTLAQAVAAAAVPGPFPSRAQLDGEIAGTVAAAARGRGDGGTVGVEDGEDVEAEARDQAIEADRDAALEADSRSDYEGGGGEGATTDDQGAGGTGVAGYTCEHGRTFAEACEPCDRELAELKSDPGTGVEANAIPIDLSTDAPAPVDIPPGKKTVRVLVCTLSATDTAARGVELAQKLQELADAQDELKTVASIKREHIKQLEHDVQRLKMATLDRTESRETECREVRDFATGTVKIYRMDTGQEITSLIRQMTEAEKDEERQVPMFSEGGNPTVTADSPPGPGENPPTDPPKDCPEGVCVHCGATLHACEDIPCATHDGVGTTLYLGSNRYACSDACAEKAEVGTTDETGGEA